MRKALVETTSAIMLIDPMTHDELAYNRPSVVTWSTFIESRLGLGQLRLLASDLKEETVDADYVAVLLASGGDEDLALAAFVSEFGAADDPGVKHPVTPVEVKADKVLQPKK